MEDIDTRFNRDVGTGEGPLDGDTSVFMHGVKLIGKNRVQYVDDKVVAKLVWYVLHNCEEVEPFLHIYKEELEKEGAHDVDKRLEEGFAVWFKSHILQPRKEKPNVVNEGLYALSRGPDLRVKSCAACIVNGVWYSTIDKHRIVVS